LVRLRLFALAEASLGHSVIGGYEQPVFLGILGVAVVFEASWYAIYRTNAVARQPTADRAGRVRQI
jgi:hypothetical protein